MSGLSRGDYVKLVETDWNEQNGLAHSIKGLLSRYRNPTAHQTRLLRQSERPIVEREVLEILTAVSLVHHALDTADPHLRS